MACSRCGKSKPNVTRNPSSRPGSNVRHPSNGTRNSVKDAINGLKYVPSDK